MAFNNAALNLQAIKESAKADLAALLDKVSDGRRKKTLILDPKMQGPLMMVADKKMLSEKGVEKTQVLQPGAVECDSKDVVYITRPSQEAMLMIVDNLRHFKKKKIQKDVHVFMVPRRTIVAERILEDEEVRSSLATLDEFDLEMVPLDEDLISLELPDCFRECYLDKNRESLYYVAKAIMKLQIMFGIFPHIRGKGHCSKVVCDMLVRMRKEMRIDDLKVPPEVDSLVLLDRDLDLVSPLLTQMTYEGLIDELYGISSSMTVVLATEITGPPPNLPPNAAVPKTMKVPLNATDDLHKEIRDLSIPLVSRELARQAENLTQIEREREGLQDKGISDIKDFVKKLKEMNIDRMKLLFGMHTNLTFDIKTQMKDHAVASRLEIEQELLRGSDASANEAVDENIYLGKNLTKLLRLICLQSQLMGGTDRYEFLASELVLTYGYKTLFTLANLEKLRMLQPANMSRDRPFSEIISAFDLLSEEVDDKTREDLRYLYGGFAPLLVRLAEMATTASGWRSSPYEGSLKLLPGSHIEIAQKTSLTGDTAEAQADDDAPKVVLVCFIGGCTFAEISGVRLLQKLDKKKRKYIIITTKIINGDRLIDSVMESLIAQTAAEVPKP